MKIWSIAADVYISDITFNYLIADTWYYTVNLIMDTTDVTL